MSSLIEGYNYDIFISYRQKDNKGDKWVSEFVEALKTELESTFKEEISVYFDINPSDYLLESYDVDASLKDKLKCLVFIPIFSRTYCDPKSFAWEHEFKAFIEQASKDQYGLKVKLTNGNVASRVLPVRIHELDPADIKECETVLGGVLRGIEFIYKEAGIDKPLAPDDDEKKNLNGTKYRIQLIKVAHSIKEIILGMKHEPTNVEKEKEQLKVSVKEVKAEEIKGVKDKPSKTGKGRFLIPIAIVALLIIAGIIAYPKIFKKGTLKSFWASGERISIAVMPFQNLTNDTLFNIYQKTVQENLTTYLSTFYNELKIIETGSVNALIQSKNLTNYKSITSSIASTISKKLGANIFLSGSIQQAGNKLRMNAKLIDAKTLEILNSTELEGLNKEETIFDITDSLRKKVTDYLLVSKIIKERFNPVNTFGYDPWEILTKSPQALRYLNNGSDAFFKPDFQTARNWLLKALAIDSNIIMAKYQLAYTYEGSNIEEARKWSQNLYDKVAQMSPLVKLSVEMLYARLNRTPYDEINLLKKGLEINDQSPETYYNLGFCYNKVYDYDNAIIMFKKYFGIINKWGIKPVWYYPYTFLGQAYHNTGQYKEEKKLYIKAEQDFPDNINIIYRQAILALTEGDEKKSNEYIAKYISILKEGSTSEAAITVSLATIYSEAGVLDKAESNYRQALLLEPEAVGRKNTLAYFLIDKERSINEGLKLVDTLLKSRPDNYNYLHTKGWGLFKLGKYQEAKEILQKSWDIRREKAVYFHAAYLHLEAAKKAVAGMK